MTEAPREGFLIVLGPDTPTPSWADGRVDIASDGRELPIPEDEEEE